MEWRWGGGGGGGGGEAAGIQKQEGMHTRTGKEHVDNTATQTQSQMIKVLGFWNLPVIKICLATTRYPGDGYGTA